MNVKQAIKNGDIKINQASMKKDLAVLFTLFAITRQVVNNVVEQDDEVDSKVIDTIIANKIMKTYQTQGE